jgi:HlyD family secretion protein
VDTALSLAERYAAAELQTMARNELLDAVQDREFLGEKQGFLGWNRTRTANAARPNWRYSTASGRLMR